MAPTNSAHSDGLLAKASLLVLGVSVACYGMWGLPGGVLAAGFSTVPGLFEHKTDASERDSFFAPAPEDPKFGLILPSFRELHEKVNAMRAKGDNVKVLYLLRHAEGHHNEAERDINDKEKWFKDEGLKEKYVDADLNAAGVRQSEKLSERLGVATGLGLKVEHLLTSPLRRAVRTAGIGFNLTDDRRSNAMEHYSALTDKKAIAHEMARETLGLLTCDKRLTRDELQKTFSWVDYSGIAQADELWKADHRETVAEKKARVRKFLQWVWKQYLRDTYFVIATHSGWINAALKELNVIDEASTWKPANAQMMGLVVRMDEN
mmetsp:Transcript_28174/g.68529  ORF Transcript_28174/g.68529 Transcript_28174/m.68529 type:complete len:320 (-) Transcript_28174:79-1038(-)